MAMYLLWKHLSIWELIWIAGLKKALLHFILDLYSDVYDLSLILEQNPNATLKQITISQCHKSSCSDSHLVQNLTLFKIPPCSKSHLAQNPILLSLFLFPLRLLSISLLILRLAQSPNLLKHPSCSNSCLAVALLVPHLLVENVLADPHTCCQSACSLYRLLFVSLLTLHLLKGAGPVMNA